MTRPGTRTTSGAGEEDGLRVLVADDNAVIRAGLASLLTTMGGVAQVLEAADGEAAAELAERERPDLVLLDVRMPGGDGLSALPRLVPISTVVMLTYSDEPQVISAAMAGGARGYLVHGDITEEHLSGALRICRDGGTVLGPGVVEVLMNRAGGADVVGTPAEHPDASPDEPPPTSPRQPPREELTGRELEIMSAIATGASNADIAGRLFLSEKTVKNHINRIYDKRGYRTRSEAIVDWLGSTR